MDSPFLKKQIIYYIYILICVLVSGCQQAASDNKDEIVTPKVNTIDPADTSNEIAPDQIITITFNKEMDGATVNTDNIKLFDQSGIEVVGDVTLEVDIATFEPDDYLEKDRDYTVEVLNSIKDLDGNNLDKDYASSFSVVFNSKDESEEMVRNIAWEFNVSTNMDSTTDVTYEIVATPDHGSVTFNGATATFDPEADYVGADSFTFRANNGIDVSDVYAIDVTIDYPLFSDTDQNEDLATNDGEDSDYTINPQSFVYSDASEDTVLDVVTNLMWQKNHNGSDSSADYTPDDASTDCSNLEQGGFDDWRLPSIKELMNVTLWDDSSSMLDLKFTETGNVDYWAVESFPKQGSSYFFYFEKSHLVTRTSDTSANTWCVRGKQKNAKFRDNGDGTISDAATGLSWQQNVTEKYNWEDAIYYCDNLTLANKSDWRLPNIKELLSLVDFTKEDPAIDKNFFPNAKSYYFWTSTGRSTNRATKYIHFGTGRSGWAALSNDFETRCVRGE